MAQEQNGLFGQMPAVGGGEGAQGLLGLRAKESEATESLNQVIVAGCYRSGWAGI